jgi:hypothetical protein
LELLLKEIYDTAIDVDFEMSIESSFHMQLRKKLKLN